MKRTGFLLLGWLVASGAGSAEAQNFLLNSAETINKGNFKLGAYPVVLLGEDDADNEWGVAGRFGYGFTDSFDVEAKVAFFDGLKTYGADAEVWLVKGVNDVSVAVGARRSDYEGDLDATAIDTSLLLSRNVGSNLELYGGVSLSFESFDDIDDSSFTRAYLVPGIEYKVSDDLDLVAEIGLGINDDSPNYLGFGLAFYVR
ncbi:MAG TPA: outer membrane beta-barrel protein [Vicinamibacteria bacterium]|nr:outer membrane beta-barrel protein [Vicinamibacteria bacterium]